MNPFASVFQTFSDNTVLAFFIVFGISLVIGVAMALTYKAVKKGEVYTKFMPIAMIVVPLAMTTLIGLINMRNIEIESDGYVRVALVVSAGVALTRFRSDKLSMLDMVYLIVASTLGIVLGIGYFMYPIIVAFVVIAIMLIAHKLKFGENKDGVYTLKYQVGEDLANDEVFEKAISKEASGCEDCLSALFARVPQQLASAEIAGFSSTPEYRDPGSQILLFVTEPTLSTRGIYMEDNVSIL